MSTPIETQVRQAKDESVAKAKADLTARIVAVIQGDGTDTERVRNALGSPAAHVYIAQAASRTVRPAAVQDDGGEGAAPDHANPALEDADEGTRKLVDEVLAGTPPWTRVMGEFQSKRRGYLEQRQNARRQFMTIKADGWPGEGLETLEDAVERESKCEGTLRLTADNCSKLSTPRTAAEVTQQYVSTLRELSLAATRYYAAIDAVRIAIKVAAEDAAKWLREDCARKLEALIQQGVELDKTPVPENVKRVLENASAAIEISKAVLLQAGLVLGAVAPLTLGISGAVAGGLGVAEMIAEPLIKARVAKKLAEIDDTVLALAGWDTKEHEQHTLERLETGHFAADVTHQVSDIAQKGMELGAELGPEHVAHGLETGAGVLESILGPAGATLKSAGYALHCAKSPAELRQYAKDNRIDGLKGAIKQAFELRNGLPAVADKTLEIHEFGDPSIVSIGGERGKLYSHGVFVSDDSQRGFRMVCSVIRRRGWNTDTKKFSDEEMIAQTATGYRARAKVFIDTPGGWDRPGMYPTEIEIPFEADKLTYTRVPWPFNKIVKMKRCTENCHAMDDDADAVHKAVELLDNKWLMQNHMDEHPYWDFVTVSGERQSGGKMYYSMKVSGQFPREHLAAFEDHFDRVSQSWGGGIPRSSTRR
jgi:hypothetical protein